MTNRETVEYRRDRLSAADGQPAEISRRKMLGGLFLGLAAVAVPSLLAATPADAAYGSCHRASRRNWCHWFSREKLCGYRTRAACNRNLRRRMRGKKAW